MPLIAPTYLSKRTLPYASDVLYHDRLVYFLPTGFHPIEIHSIAGLPSYCHGRSIALPGLIWDSCSQYFESSKEAADCTNILEPFRKNTISLVTPVYPRDRRAIDKARSDLATYPVLLDAFRSVDLDMRFVARELLSHVLFGVFIEEGYEGSIKYLQLHSQSPEALLSLVAAVILNRLKLFASGSSELLLYEHSWYPLISELSSHQENGPKISDSNLVEYFSYKLFEAILLPLFGRIDSKKKADVVANISDRRASAVLALKTACQAIAQEVVLLPTTDSVLRQRALTAGVSVRIIDPLTTLLRKPKRDVMGLLRDFILDSTVVGGLLLAATETNTGSAVGLALAAGTISTGVKYLLSERQSKPVQPAELLISGMQQAAMEELKLEQHLRKLAVQSLEFPVRWKASKSAT